jgi:hypothetical protein
MLEPVQDRTFTLTSISSDFDIQTPLLQLAKGQVVTVRGTMQNMFMTLITMQRCTLVQ